MDWTEGSGAQFLTTLVGITISALMTPAASSLGPRFYTEAAPETQARNWRAFLEICVVRLSTKGRYAVMAMADLAGHEGGTRPVSLAEIAKRQEISLSYLEQLFAKLRRGGL